MNFDALLNPGVLIFLIPILAVTGWIVTVIAKHRERMAMIEHGIDPDTRTPVSAPLPQNSAMRR